MKCARSAIKTFSAVALILLAVMPLCGYAIDFTKGDIKFPGRKAGEVIFSHRKHVLKNSVPCESCHVRIESLKRKVKFGHW